MLHEMEYNSDDNIQFIVFHDDKIEILFGKITNVTKTSLKVALSEASFEKSGLKQEVVTIHVVTLAALSNQMSLWAKWCSTGRHFLASDVWLASRRLERF